MKNATRTSILLALAAALALPAAAAAKGPSTARISGPGIAGSIAIPGDGEGGGGPLTTVVMEGGYFPLVFGQSPDPSLRSRPRGDLGPAYVITYVVPAGNTRPHRIVETVYPYAAGGPVLHMRPLQVVWDGQTTYGGWFRAPVAVKAALVEAGLSASPPRSGNRLLWSPGVVAAAALLALLLVAGATFGVRRRARPAAAAH